jgi:serine/threonine protein kinase
MELIEGETLASRLLRGPLPAGQVIQVALEMLDALSTAHAAGIIHRDLKPASIMLTKSGVKRLDLGLARLRPQGRTLGSASGADQDPLTATGLVFGTVPYMSPEQVRGQEADARSDLFSLGAVFYEMLSGRRAFAAGSEPALIATILERDPSKEPAQRWQHARDVALALGTIAEGRPVSLSQTGTATAAKPGWSISAATWGRSTRGPGSSSIREAASGRPRGPGRTRCWPAFHSSPDGSSR